MAEHYIIINKARFSCLSPWLVRMEYDADAIFEDLPSFRAISRPATVPFASRSQHDRVHVLDTGSVRITYTDDGLPFSEKNLVIRYLRDGQEVSWDPSVTDGENLGGGFESYDEYSRSFVPQGVAEAGLEDIDVGTLAHIAKMRKAYAEFYGIPWNGKNPVREWQFEAKDRLDELPEELRTMIKRRLTYPAGILSRRGCFLLNDSATALFDPATDWWRPRPEREIQDWYFFGYGLDYARGLQDFTRLCGSIPMLPKWVFGIWFSVFRKIDDAGNREIVERFRAEGLPLDVMVIDLYWHTHDWFGFDWNREWYPEPRKLIDWMHTNGVRVGLNVHPGSLPESDSQFKPLCDELGIGPSDLEQRKTERPGVFDLWDISRKRDADLIVEKLLRPVQEDGIDLWWVDGPSPTKVVPDTAWTNHVYYTALEKHTQQRPVILSRYGGLGCHRYPIQFTGDTASQWEVLRSQVDLTARGGNVGDSYLSHDIGGFVNEEFWDGRVNPELFVRWVQFGCFSPVLRFHSCFGIREPWEYGKKVLDAIRDALRLRMSLIPYIYHHSRLAHTTGMPLCRPLYLHYPKDDNAYRYTDEYLFGENLLVAPVVASGGELVVYLPEGTWYDWGKSTTITGPKKQYLLINYDQIPVYVKAGSIIPRQEPAASTALASAESLILDIYPGGPGTVAELELYEDDGASRAYRNGSFAFTRYSAIAEDGGMTISISPTEGGYQGIPETRNYVFNIFAAERPTRVTVNGKILPFAPEVEPIAGRWSFCHPAATVGDT